MSINHTELPGFSELESIQKLSVLHCVYQLIASADGKMNADRDAYAMEYVLSELAINEYAWQNALQLNPHDAFFHIQRFRCADKELFKKLMLRIAEMGGNAERRRICAESLFVLCEVK